MMDDLIKALPSPQAAREFGAGYSADSQVPLKVKITYSKYDLLVEISRFNHLEINIYEFGGAVAEYHFWGYRIQTLSNVLQKLSSNLVMSYDLAIKLDLLQTISPKVYG